LYTSTYFTEDSLNQPPRLHEALCGNRDALEELAAYCWPAVFGYLARLSGSRELARDLAQDAMVRALESLETFTPREGAGFMPWLFRIARNRYFDHVRRSGREVPRPEGEGAEEPAGEHDPTGLAAIAGAEAALLQAALGQLNPADRELLELRYWYGFTHREAAAVTDTTAALVKSRLNAALGRLRKQYSVCEKEQNHVSEKA